MGTLRVDEVYQIWHLLNVQAVLRAFRKRGMNLNKHRQSVSLSLLNGSIQLFGQLNAVYCLNKHKIRYSNELGHFVRLDMTNEVPFDVQRKLRRLFAELLYIILAEESLSSFIARLNVFDWLCFAHSKQLTRPS